MIETIPKKKKCKKVKWLSDEVFQIAKERRENLTVATGLEKQGIERKLYPTECRVPKNRKER